MNAPFIPSIPSVTVKLDDDRTTFTAADGYVCTVHYDAPRDYWRLESPWAVPAPPKPFRNAHFNLRRRIHEALNPDRFVPAAATATHEDLTA